MNKRNQGSQSRGQGQEWQSQSQTRGMRPDRNYEQDENEGMMSGSRPNRQSQFQNANYSGMSSFGEESDESESYPSYRDTDYDLDGSTYGANQERSNRSMMSGRNRSSYTSDYETNDRNRTPSRFSSLDDSRSDSSSERFGSSSERFGYPAQMNSWSSNRSSGSGVRSQGRDYDMGSQYGSQKRSQSGSEYRPGSRSQFGMNSQFGNQSEMGMGSSQSYGDNSFRNDWGSSSSEDRGFYGKGPKGYKRSDERIKEEVCETLARNPRVDASDIEVKVEEACVTLSGTVDSKEIKRAAEMAIENLSGVDDVRNELKVKKAGIMDTLFGSHDSKDSRESKEYRDSRDSSSSRSDTISAVGSSSGSSANSASKSSKGTSHI